MNVLYDFVDEVEVETNEEGIYEWKNVEFAWDFNNKELAGFANISQFIIGIFDLEEIKKFFK